MEDILGQARARGKTKNVMGYFVVGDLFVRNNNIMKVFEKNDFYINNRHKQNVIEILQTKENDDPSNINSYDGGLSSVRSSVDLNYNSNSTFISKNTVNSKSSANFNDKEPARNLDKFFEINKVKKYFKSFLICYEE